MVGGLGTLSQAAGLLGCNILVVLGKFKIVFYEEGRKRMGGMFRRKAGISQRESVSPATFS
jgi:hypothetical protein